jgi:hypothetical protein
MCKERTVTGVKLKTVLHLLTCDMFVLFMETASD